MSPQNNDPPRRITRADAPAQLAAPAMARPEVLSYATQAGRRELSPKLSSAQGSSCSTCEGAGWYVFAVPYGDPNFGKLHKCSCAAYAQQIADRAARLGDELGSLADKTFASFDLTRQLEATTWQGQDLSIAAQKIFMLDGHRRCMAWSSAPRAWLYIHGAFGAGKSHLAAAIANDGQAHGRSVRFVTINKLLDTLTAALRLGTSDSLIDDLIACDLLILDELASSHLAECASDWRFGRIERLINERLSRPTVITSNFAPDDLAQPGDLRAERIADRVAGASQIVWLPLASYRRIAQGVRA